jgi:transmembrane sensor
LNKRIEQEALDWVIRLAEPDFADWDTFDAWLATDPAHGEAYWPMAEADRMIGAALAATPHASVSDIAAYRARRWGPIVGWAIAASLVAIVGSYALLRAPAAGDMIVETRPGVTRALELPDGSHVALNGGTRIVVNPENPRQVRLDRGEASFAVRHDASRPFTLGVGSAVIVDIGTRFDVIRDGGEIRLAVAEGAVRYDRDHRTQTLGAGQTLRAADGADTIALGSVDPAFVSGWRTHRLVYDRAPLPTVVADLTRTTGLEVSLSPDLADRAFTGTISTDGPGEDVVARFAAMMDVRAARRAHGWILTRR